MNAQQTVLVTGAAGFSGGYLLERLAGRRDLVAWARAEPPPALAGLARWARIDLRDRDTVRREIRALKPGAVFHCAGASQVGASWGDTAGALEGNALITHYLLDAIRRSGAASRVLVTGSASVYAASARPLREEDPLAPASPYALSKLAQEALSTRALADDGVQVVLTRSFNHTGPRQSPAFAAPSMARQIALAERRGAEPVVTVGNLDAVRDLTDVRDTVRAYDLLMDQAVPGTIYNVASGVARPVRAVLDALRARAAIDIRVEIDAARLRPHDTPVVLGDAGRLRDATGWTPLIPFDRTIDDLLEYWRSSV